MTVWITVQAPPGQVTMLAGKYVTDAPTDVPNTVQSRRSVKLGRLELPRLETADMDIDTAARKRRVMRVLSLKSRTWGPNESAGEA